MIAVYRGEHNESPSFKRDIRLTDIQRPPCMRAQYRYLSYKAVHLARGLVRTQVGLVFYLHPDATILFSAGQAMILESHVLFDGR